MSLQMKLEDGSVVSSGTLTTPVLWQASSQGGATDIRVLMSSTVPEQEYFADCVIKAVDTVGDDESGWFSFSLEVNGAAGQYVPELTFDVAQGSQTPIWIRGVFPASDSTDAKTDIQILVNYIRIAV